MSSPIRQLTVRTKLRFSTTCVGDLQPAELYGQLAPVAVTAICEEDEVVEDVVVHPLNIVKPTPLTRSKRAICKRRRLLKARRDNAAAIMLPGITGLGPW
jgi:hypothetical protein